MQHPRTMLSDQWCIYHWAPYAKASEPVQAWVNMRVPRLLWQRPEFHERLKALRRRVGSLRNAPMIALHEWVQARQCAACCILGDAAMEGVLRECRNNFGVPL